VAAHLARGVPIARLGPARADLQRLPTPRARRVEGLVVGEILYADRFGNLVTSILAQDLAGACRVRVAEHDLPLRATYSEAAQGELLALVGSSGRIEVALRDGSAALALGLAAGDPVLVEEDGR